MPRAPMKPKEKNTTVAVCLTPALVKALAADRTPGESVSAQFRRLLIKALDLENDPTFRKF